MLSDSASFRGTWRIRTAVYGFADRCLATRPKYHSISECKDNRNFQFNNRMKSHKIKNSDLRTQKMPTMTQKHRWHFRQNQFNPYFGGGFIPLL